jgi:hypothetical protein
MLQCEPFDGAFVNGRLADIVFIREFRYLMPV